MIVLRKSRERGHAEHGWLESFHTFSFANYYDPKHRGFGTLRVLNEDRVEPGHGFPAHSHRDAEILSYVIEGALEHKDSLGSGSVIRPGDVQRMSAGRGVTHSEYNHSKSERVHFLQIWILPQSQGIEPSYEQKHFAIEGRTGKLLLVASGDGRAGAIKIHQDVDVYATILGGGEQLTHEIGPGRAAWLQVVRGQLQANGVTVSEGDGASLRDEPSISLTASGPSEALLFDLG